MEKKKYLKHEYILALFIYFIYLFIYFSFFYILALCFEKERKFKFKRYRGCFHFIHMRDNTLHKESEKKTCGQNCSK